MVSLNSHTELGSWLVSLMICIEPFAECHGVFLEIGSRPPADKLLPELLLNHPVSMDDCGDLMTKLPRLSNQSLFSFLFIVISLLFAYSNIAHEPRSRVIHRCNVFSARYQNYPIHRPFLTASLQDHTASPSRFCYSPLSGYTFHSTGRCGPHSRGVLAP